MNGKLSLIRKPTRARLESLMSGIMAQLEPDMAESLTLTNFVTLNLIRNDTASIMGQYVIHSDTRTRI